ncbi:hypothetical protein WUBG_01032 [Wuchereria bancrofti]|uniref:Uncharacterized protein n=1 Tax=Wuchereria bancrofti TaxID=6293 RepID=J9BKT2_WUCBA|nr:hypothetical protein WUBG_01032 [Wuchereria bancrofti]VDM10740.1 unnamed protein product [Wuchereria bancrofti]
MERQCMEFIDVEEMELFMSRYLVMVYDDRLYIRRDHMGALSAINKLSNVSFDSILPDDFISTVFEYMIKRDKELLYTSEQSSSILSIKCGGCKRSTLFDSFPYITVCFIDDDTSDTLSPSLKSYLNVMHCLLSLAVSLHDPWSATRLLSKVCPKVLPALRRSAQESMGYLNIMSVLISYVMTAPVEDDCNIDVELHANFPVLKKLVDTVITMNETLQSGTQSNQAVKCALQIAAEFMVIIPNYTNPSVMNKMIIYLNKNVEQLSANFAVISSTIWNNEYQTKTSNQTDAYVIALSLCDRLTCLNVAEDIGVVSPLFKTPNNKAVVSNPLTPINQKVVAEEITTPDMQERRIANFINIDTPISRSLDKVEMFDNPTVLMKENIPTIPKNSGRKIFSKALISISKKKKLPCRKLNPFTDVKGNQRKCTDKDVKGQTKITNFFKKYS